ncbi:MAG: proline--tRNA ligase [Peptococcaceae bacterium]|nr:proline--tRNA ligase [Peptococcaceae bacterium]
MKVRNLLNPTLREAPAEAEIMSHQLMYRAGLIRKVAAGMYTYLPLGWRVIKKIEDIIREEMDGIGGQEVMMPVIQPAELWQKTGRWDVYGPEMFRVQDRHGRSFCLGPTHEEIITDLVRAEVRSYKELPLLLYQIQNKYRDERRPRFGLMRGREFIMKDLYSFDRGPEEGAVSYRRMYEAYERVFRRCGLSFRAVEADAGAIGGTGGTHEFMVLADSGEAAVVFCPECAYAANVERAECADEPLCKAAEASPGGVPDEVPEGVPDGAPDGVPDEAAKEAGLQEARGCIPAYEEMETPGVRTIAQLADFCGCEPRELVKALVYIVEDTVAGEAAAAAEVAAADTAAGEGTAADTAADKVVIALMRGDQDLNEVKLANLLEDRLGRVPDLALASPEKIEKLFSCEPGSLGPVGLPERMIAVADRKVMDMVSAVCGANKNDRHLRDVVPGRDFVPDYVGDLKLVAEGDGCPKCGRPLQAARGIEVGQVFNLGYKYSEKLGAAYLDQQGKEQVCYMATCGIGVSRTMAAAIEQNFDDHGIVWPMAIAPYQCIVVPVNVKDKELYETAERIYHELGQEGVEVVLDDRDERPGVKFKDADLVGYPLRITVGAKALAEGQVELLERGSGQMERVAVGDVVRMVRERVRE